MSKEEKIKYAESLYHNEGYQKAYIDVVNGEEKMMLSNGTNTVIVDDVMFEHIKNKYESEK
jgi:hypothetical protein